MVQRGTPHGASALYLSPGVRFLNEEEAVLTGMYKGWEAQQVGGRNNQVKSAQGLRRSVEQFRKFTNEWPWNWNAGAFDEWMMDLASVQHLKSSTLRTYQQAVRSFCDYICSEHYGWVQECEARFGTHPTQVCHDWNTIRHLQDYEGHPSKRALTRDEVQRMVDYADAQVSERLDAGRKGALQLYRDATILKVIYGWGLRANEAVNLEVSDFYRNPEAPEFGKYGILQVRLGKASPGGEPKRRSVLSLRQGAVNALRDYIDNVWPLVRVEGSNSLWLSERGNTMRTRELQQRFGENRDALGLEAVLTPHCLRHSYVTHLIEEGYDPKFVKEQVGHRFGSTTSLYTHVDGDFANTMMRRALLRTRKNVAAQGEER